MGLIASLISGLKAEVEWLIASLAVAPAAGDVQTTSDTPQADAKAAEHDSDTGAGKDSAVLNLADQQPDNSSHSGTPHASGNDTPSSESNAQDAGVAAAHIAAPLLFVDFTTGTGANSDPLPVLTPLSSDANTPGPEAAGASETPLPSHDGLDFHPSMPAVDLSSVVPNPGTGDFTLASLNPELYGGFASGHGGSSKGGGGTPGLTYNTPTEPNSNLHISLNFDSSVANAPGGLNLNAATGFVHDMEQVANFFASNFSNSASITIDVGFGEVAGSRIGNSALGESETYYVQVPGANAAAQYTNLQHAYASADSAVSPLPADPVSGSQAWWVTTAEGKALGLYSGTGVDGYIGFSSSAGTFAYDPSSIVPGSNVYDFMGVAAHEISEVMGRATLNGGKYFAPRTPEYSPLDIFHYSSPTTHIFSGTTAGYFSLDGSMATDPTYGAEYRDFNISSSGDFSDWALSGPSDAFDWAGGQGSTSPVSYVDYLAMEAVGYLGTGWPGTTSIL